MFALEICCNLGEGVLKVALRAFLLNDECVPDLQALGCDDGTTQTRSEQLLHGNAVETWLRTTWRWRL